MKKSRLNSLAFVLLATVILSSCGGLNKMVKMAPQVRYSVSPEVLEMHADSVEIIGADWANEIELKTR